MKDPMFVHRAYRNRPQAVHGRLTRSKRSTAAHPAATFTAVDIHSASPAATRIHQLSALLALTVTVLSSAIGSAQGSGPLPFPTLPTDAAVGSGQTVPCLENAPTQVRCGRFRVLEDRTQPNGATIDLAFIVAEAIVDAAEATDAVTFFLGGPGSSATRSAPGLIGAFRSLLQERDLLFLDFRGVGASSALSCDDPYPRGVASRLEDLFPLDHAKACAQRLSEQTQLDQYTSLASLEDLNQLRAWLGYTQLNIYSGSYGTREVQVLLRHHPEIVRSVVLIAVSPIFHKPYLSHARGLQDALDTLIAECASNQDCSSHYPNLAGDLQRVLKQAKSDPATITAEDQQLPFGPGALGYALRGLLYRQGHEVPYYIHQAASGNWQPLADYFLTRQAWVAQTGGETGYHWSVICAEGIQFVTDDDVAKQTKDTFLGSFLIDAYRDVCRIWPHAKLPASFLAPVTSPVPTLILSGERDPVTPVSKGNAVAEHLPNAEHIVVPNGGHGVWDPCYLRMIDSLISTGGTEDLDRSCIGSSGATQFRPPD